MNNKLNIPQAEMLSRYPLFSGLNNLKPLGGSIQLNMLINDEQVLHVSPAPNNALTAAEVLACSRWLFESKSTRITEIHRLAADLQSSVSAPSILDAGELIDGEERYYYWKDQYIKGPTLTEYTFREGQIYKFYLDLIIWLASYHNLSEVEHTSLANYYRDRVLAYKEMFQSMQSKMEYGQETYEYLLRVLNYMNKLVLQSVSENEVVDLVHGDLHGGNIILGEERLYVLDFEQGANGGDWYTDLSKLLLLHKDDQPDSSKPYKYAPPLLQAEKMQLLRTYMAERIKTGWDVPSWLASEELLSSIMARTELQKLDNMLAVLALGYVSGWHYRIENNTKGTLFILELIKQDYGQL